MFAKLIFIITMLFRSVQTEPTLAIRQLSSIEHHQGVLAAQAYFLKNFFRYSDDNRHYLGHFLGEHIYKTYGLSGLAHCYSSIEFGCIHGFLLTGYLKEGNGFLKQATDRCTKDLPEGCMHGLGHAYVITRGYELDDVHDSIDACRKLDVEKGWIDQCIQGVYMEYNDRFVAGLFVPRTFDPDYPLAPCDSEAIDLQPLCFRELVLYWTNISGVTRDAMAEYCDLIANPEGKYECFWSLGGVIAGDDASIDPSINVCEELAGDMIPACLHGAVMSVAFQSQKPAGALCDQIPHVYKQECLRWSPFDPAATRKELGSSISKKGALATYNEMKRSLLQADSLRQHSVAHIFGELLYRKEGVEGIVVCDDSFGFGCYHSFMGSAVAQEGEGIIKRLDDTCVAKFGPMGLGCPHGIGHGLGEYFGPEHIDKQLAACSTLSWKGRYFGCRGGVFMEYNTPLSKNGQETTTIARPFDATKPYGVCDDVQKKDQPACFLELTGWWERVLEKDYSRIGTLCAHATRDNRESCFLGVGYAAVQSNGYDIGKTKEICEMMPTSEGQLLCKAGASWSFFANPKQRQKALALCEGSSICEQKSDLLSY